MCWKYLTRKSPCKTNGLISKTMNARCLQLFLKVTGIHSTDVHAQMPAKLVWVFSRACRVILWQVLVDKLLHLSSDLGCSNHSLFWTTFQQMDTDLDWLFTNGTGAIDQKIDTYLTTAVFWKISNETKFRLQSVWIWEYELWTSVGWPCTSSHAWWAGLTKLYV